MTTARELDQRYATVVANYCAEDGKMHLETVRLALSFAIADGIILGQSIAGREATNLRQIENLQAQITRLNEWLAANAPAQYWTPTNTAEAVLAVLQQMQHDLTTSYARADTQAALHRSELAGLRQQLAVANRESTERANQLAIERREVRTLIEEIENLRNQLSEAQAKIDQPHLAAHTNGANPTPAAQSQDWGRSHPAWQGLPAADLAMIDQLVERKIKSRNLSQALRREIVARAIRYLTSERNGTLSCSDWDRYRPAWLPTQGAVVMLADDNRWPTLLAMAMALEPATA